MIQNLILQNLSPPVPSSIVFKHTALSVQMVYKRYPSMAAASADLTAIAPLIFWYDANGVLTNGVFAIMVIMT